MRTDRVEGWGQVVWKEKGTGRVERDGDFGWRGRHTLTEKGVQPTRRRQGEDITCLDATG